MPDNQLLKALVLKLIAYYWVLLLIGLFIDRIATSLLVGSLVLLLVNIKEFVDLVNWIWHSPHKREMKVNSSWRHIYTGIDKSIKANRKRRKQLIVALSHFREGADALPDGVVVFNQDNAILWCNRAARNYLGLQWPVDQGQLLNNLIRGQEFRQYIIRGQFDKVLELPSPHNDAVLLEHRVTSYGRDLYVLVSRDITQLVRLEQMRRKFVADVSHELKTPLTVLQGYLELIEDDEGVDYQTWKKVTKTMQVQTNRMKSMVEQLLVLSKIESASQSAIEPMNIAALMQMVKEDAMALIGDRELSLQFNNCAGLMICGDEAQIFSACSNLVNNAIRYSPDGSSINVQWLKVNDGLEFSVADNGHGIAPNHITRLTERFYRVDQSRSSQTGGTGLGLSIVKHVLVNHHSILNIVSEIDRGSRFSFVIDHDLIVKS